MPATKHPILSNSIVLLLVLRITMFGQSVREHNPSEWGEFLWKIAGCSVLLPHNSDSPEYLDAEIPHYGDAGKIKGHRVIGYEGDVMYSVDYYDLPPQVSKTYLQDVRKETLRRAKGRVSYRAVSLDGNSGVEFTVRSKRHFALTRRYLVKQRLFIVAITKLDPGSAPKNVDMFLNSFKLISDWSIK
jgi:hypothetical protein